VKTLPLPADLRLGELHAYNRAVSKSLRKMAMIESCNELEPALPVEGMLGVQAEDLLGSARAAVVLDRC